MEKIIKAVSYDAVLIKNIDDVSFSKIFHEDLEYYEDNFKKGNDSYLIMLGGLPVGEFILRYEDNNTLGIESFAIVPKFRGRKLSEQMLQYIEENIAKDFKRTILEVSVDNKRAIDIYQKNGYNIINTLKDFYAPGYDAYVMEKKNGKNI